jgi:hypothetical protein
MTISVGVETGASLRILKIARRDRLLPLYVTKRSAGNGGRDAQIFD